VIRAVLFDVGGPLNTEVEHERLCDVEIRAALASAGRTVDDAGYAAACEWAVASYAPDAYAAIIWRLAAGDAALAERAERAFALSANRRQSFELREGIADVLAELHARGLLLGLAANQPSSVLPALDAAGIGGLFHHRQVSGTHGYRKPDVRLFLACCDDLRVSARECVMVGDRIDNDVAPAKLLGMRTVLFRTGRHVAQQPRSAAEVPDAEVRDVDGLRRALDSLLADG
jgi:putative hydrolase of the HAD superfamily